MLSRFSHVNHIKITTLLLSSITQMGDSQIINCISRALAVHREAEIFLENEGEFSNYPIFSVPIPLPPVEDDLLYQRINVIPCIKVSNIDIIGVSASSVVHIGSTDHVYMEARVKHIRQLIDEK